MARVISARAMNKIVAPLDPVQDAVERQAKRIQSRAEMRLAAHRKTGEHRIEVEKNLNAKYGYLDYEISLVGEAPLSVEFGHEHKFSGKHVAGLYIITGAAGLI